MLNKIHNTIHEFESNPITQLKFHTVMTVLWLITMVGVIFFPVLYGHQAAPLIIEEISLYANFATEYGAMSAAIAAKKQKEED